MQNRNLPIQSIKHVDEYFEKEEKRLSALLPQGVSLEFMQSNIAMAISANPKLLGCTRASIFRSVAEACELGLMVHSVLGEAWIVPYGTTATLVVGYMGFVKLAYESGFARRIESRVVFSNDHFELQYGTHPKLLLQEAHGNRGSKKGVYCLVELMTGGVLFEYYTAEKLENVHSKSRAYDYYKRTGKGAEIWGDEHNRLEMDRKAVWRNVSKWVPRRSTQFAKALEIDARSYEGSWEVPEDAEDRLLEAVGASSSNEPTHKRRLSGEAYEKSSEEAVESDKVAEQEEVSRDTSEDLQDKLFLIFGTDPLNLISKTAALVLANPLPGDPQDGYELPGITTISVLEEPEQAKVLSVIERAETRLIGKRLRDGEGNISIEGLNKLQDFFRYCTEESIVLTTTRQVDDAKKAYVRQEKEEKDSERETFVPTDGEAPF